MVKIKIIRHSERLDFTYPLYWLVCFGQFWSDTPLTANGHKIAKDKAIKMRDDNFNPSHIYTSPYTRTMATATEIKTSFPNTQILIEPLLSEYQPYFAHSTSIYPHGIPTTYNDTATEFRYPETITNFAKRIQFIIGKIIEKSDNDCILVTHGEVIKSCVTYIKHLYPELVLDPGNTPYLTVLSFEYDKINDKIIRQSVKIE